MKRIHLLSATALLALSGCAGAPAPDKHLSEANAAVRGASEAGAESLPQASLHLKLAKDQIVQAKNLMAEGYNEEARWVLERAEADAELAISQARAAEQQRRAQDVRDQVKELKGEM